MMNEFNSKNHLRQSSRVKRDRFGDEYILHASEIVCELIAQTNEFLFADTVLLYFPINNEISPLPLMKAAIKMGKSVAFPVCQRADKTLLFRIVDGLDDLKQADFGLFEPNAALKVATPTEKTLCIVPAILFSREGYRIGYGGGYYDRFLKNFNGTSVGITYDELLFDSIPHEAHDVPLNMIISEREVLYIAEKN